MSANNNWIPFINLMTQRDCKRNINYSDIQIRIPFITQVLGVSLQTPYEFSDTTLTYLLNELKIWSSEVYGQP
jgi:hypothetical protein